MTEETDARIQGEADLAAHFTAACKPRSAWSVGIEHEKCGVLADSGAPVPWDGPRGVAELLAALERAGGWTPVDEAGRCVALARGGESITLEPGCQLEFSSAPVPALARLETALRRHLAELDAESRPRGIAWLGIGFRPFGTLEDVPWVPKARYAIMREYMPTRGALAHEMMKRTSSVQVNLDCSDEDEAERKLRAAMSVTSIVTAMFACSPLVDGRDSGFASYRAHAWLDTDPDRCGLLPFAFERGGVFLRYVRWALGVPMLFLYRDGYRDVGGIPFGRFLRDGYQGERATVRDWDLHLSTLFPEARFRHYLEVRGADAGPLPMALALPALWKGILYDADACEAATRLTGHLTMDERERLRRAVPRLGLAAAIPGRGTVAEAARDLLAIARVGLDRVAAGESAALAPLDEVVATGRPPAEDVRERWRAAGGSVRELVAALRL